jgi:hypothetical protein
MALFHFLAPASCSAIVACWLLLSDCLVFVWGPTFKLVEEEEEKSLGVQFWLQLGTIVLVTTK